MKRIAGMWMTAALAAVVMSSQGAVALGTSGSLLPAGYAQERGWDAPPGELDEISRRGFHDGIEGARKDFENHRRPDVHNRDEFRHPPVHGRDRDAYRHGFERGYQVGVDHLMHGR
ncbi:hypothetical protein [Acidicapsa ligni]|uniref:hypothetical protein n=1 Tax=Acidicapsa ligni TaxID=542300 RepID=UPI0021DFFEBB|nr:hypothetical protein [Acidicapsa ligni]